MGPAFHRSPHHLEAQLQRKGGAHPCVCERETDCGCCRFPDVEAWVARVCQLLSAQNAPRHCHLHLLELQCPSWASGSWTSLPCSLEEQSQQPRKAALLLGPGPALPGLQGSLYAWPVHSCPLVGAGTTVNTLHRVGQGRVGAFPCSQRTGCVCALKHSQFAWPETLETGGD